MTIQIEYYDEGKKKIESKKTLNQDGIIDGPYEKYYKNGNLAQKGFLKTIKKGNDVCVVNVGSYESYREDGQLLEKCTFKEDGSLERIGSFEKYYHDEENSLLEEKGTYTGKKDPKFVGSYEKYGRYYVDYMGGHGDHYEGHFVIKKCTYLPDGSYDGEFEELTCDSPYSLRSNDKTKIVRCTYKKGILHGPYYEDNFGEIIECTYKDGKLDGEYKYTDMSNFLTIHCFYKDGKLDGEYEMLQGVGRKKILTKGLYQKGKKVGLWEEDGKMYTYVNGVKSTDKLAIKASMLNKKSEGIRKILKGKGLVGKVLHDAEQKERLKVSKEILKRRQTTK